MADRERERRRRRLRAKAKRRREEHRRENVGELAREHQRDPNKSRRTFLEVLKILILVVTALVFLTHLCYRTYLASELPASDALSLLWMTVLHLGVVLALGGLAFTIVLGVGALFDLTARTNDLLEVGREIHEETQFSGVMLSELSEALVEDEDDEQE
jgi:hypothetical protein